MAYIETPLQYKRLEAQPLDTQFVVTTYSELEALANDPVAYIGLICACTETNKAYLLQSDRTWKPLEGGGSAIYITGDDVEE